MPNQCHPSTSPLPVNKKATLEGHSGSAACQKNTRLESVQVDVWNSFYQTWPGKKKYIDGFGIFWPIENGGCSLFFI